MPLKTRGTAVISCRLPAKPLNRFPFHVPRQLSIHRLQSLELRPRTAVDYGDTAEKIAFPALWLQGLRFSGFPTQTFRPP
jgi:hypothetical protein